MSEFLETVMSEYNLMRSRSFAGGYEGVTHAGLAIVARDTNRMLLTQRAMDETDDPDVQESFEFPGGGLNEGEEPFPGAVRELMEETCMALPPGMVTNGWRSDDGVYQCFVYMIDAEFPLDEWMPTTEVQAVVWAGRDDLPKYTLRPEVEMGTDWDRIFGPVSGNSVEEGADMDEAAEYAAILVGPIPVHGVVAPEEAPTGDGRGFAAGSMTKRPLRLPFRDTASDIGAHGGAYVVGSVDTLMRADGLIQWEGLLMPGPAESLIEKMQFFGGRYGVSVDGDQGSVDMKRTEAEQTLWFDQIRAAGLTAVDIPAFHEAFVAFGPHPTMPGDKDETLAASAYDNGDMIGARRQFGILQIPESLDFDRGPGFYTPAGQRIHRYWTEKGQEGYQKIRWGTPGDFTRAKALIGAKIAANSPEKIKYLNQIIAQWHHDALGYWPGDLDKPGNKTTAEAKAERKTHLSLVEQVAEVRDDIEAVSEDGETSEWEAVLVSSAAGTRVRPPLSYFHEYTGDDGAINIFEPDEHGFRRVTGFAAEWGVCFSGETEYLTEQGVRTLKETVGTTQRVLASEAGFDSRPREAMEFGGVWADAEIKSFGVHPLMKVTLRRFGQTKEVFATKNHRWLSLPSYGRKNSKRQIITTENLTADTRLAPLYPKRLVNLGKGIRPGQFGISHGFTFGDGSRYRDGCRVDLFGDKDKVMEPYFALSTSWPRTNPDDVPYTRVSNLPAFFKDLPPRGESLSYLYGWLAGYFAADGTVSPDGTPILFSANRGDLEFVQDICARLGIGTTGVRTFMRKGADDQQGRTTPGKVSNTKVSPLHRLTFMASTLSEEFFIGVEHKRRFQARPLVSNAYTAWHVESVEETDRVEEVFCAVVPDLENFTLDGNINVMNCHIGFNGRCVEPPQTYSDDYPGFHKGRTKTAEGYVYTGVLTYGVGHRDATTILKESADEAFFDNLKNAWAAVRVGENERGIWFSGVVLPTVPEDDIVAIEASGQVSGEWLHDEMRACLTVNVRGFGVERPSAEYDEEGNVVALAASAFNALSVTGGDCPPTPAERMEAMRVIDAEIRFAALKMQYLRELLGERLGA